MQSYERNFSFSNNKKNCLLLAKIDFQNAVWRQTLIRTKTENCSFILSVHCSGETMKLTLTKFISPFCQGSNLVHVSACWKIIGIFSIGSKLFSGNVHIFCSFFIVEKAGSLYNNWVVNGNKFAKFQGKTVFSDDSWVYLIF